MFKYGEEARSSGARSHKKGRRERDFEAGVYKKVLRGIIYLFGGLN
jgi:hypothetical protein